jgi:hypothetical protein
MENCIDHPLGNEGAIARNVLIGTRHLGRMGQTIVNLRAVFASKQRALLPTVLMQSLSTCGLWAFSKAFIF